MDWSLVLNAVLGVATIFLGGRITKIKKAIDEIGDVPERINEALEDDKISAEELRLITKDAKEALAAVRAVFKK